VTWPTSESTIVGKALDAIGKVFDVLKVVGVDKALAVVGVGTSVGSAGFSGSFDSKSEKVD
jgi:hypothetical protein